MVFAAAMGAAGASGFPLQSAGKPDIEVSMMRNRSNRQGTKLRIPLWMLLALTCLQCTPAIGRDVACATIDGAEPVLGRPGVFIGDMHGSVEAPAFLSALTCHAVNTGRRVVVALEYDTRDQSVLDRFLQIDDEAEAVGILTSTDYWTGNRDGRASAAMRDALLDIRRLARAGGQLRLVAYDLGGASPADRDKQSADLIGPLHESTEKASYWILFGGNVHARKTKGLPFLNAPSGSEEYEPLGYLVREWGLAHLDVAYRGGTSWGCIGPSPDDCKTLELGPRCTGDCPAHPVIRLGSTDPAFDGVYDVGSLTASRPLHR